MAWLSAQLPLLTSANLSRIPGNFRMLFSHQQPLFLLLASIHAPRSTHILPRLLGYLILLTQILILFYPSFTHFFLIFRRNFRPLFSRLLSVCVSVCLWRPLHHASEPVEVQSLNYLSISRLHLLIHLPTADQLALARIKMLENNHHFSSSSFSFFPTSWLAAAACFLLCVWLTECVAEADTVFVVTSTVPPLMYHMCMTRDDPIREKTYFRGRKYFHQHRFCARDTYIFVGIFF